MAAPELTFYIMTSPLHFRHPIADAGNGGPVFREKDRLEGGKKRNTVTLAFIAFSRSRRPILIIEKIAVTKSVSGKKVSHIVPCLASAGTVVLEACPVKTGHLQRVEQ